MMAATVCRPGYWVCCDQVNNGACDTMWWPNGASGAKLVQNLAPGTYYWPLDLADAGARGATLSEVAFGRRVEWVAGRHPL